MLLRCEKLIVIFNQNVELTIAKTKEKLVLKISSNSYILLPILYTTVDETCFFKINLIVIITLVLKKF